MTIFIIMDMQATLNEILKKLNKIESILENNPSINCKHNKKKFSDYVYLTQDEHDKLCDNY